MALDRADGPVVVGHGLTLGDLADHALAGLGERDDGRRCPAALCVGDDGGLAALHHGHTGIGGAEINADHDCHADCLLISLLRSLLRVG